ncbi:hypothetical protein Scep_023994 [Stephania cephalantha]|uniref:Uncharacterized protein n=1 Tax=Stephania cephalantha TaxID=152367 RepID=A0AAP0EWD3_9MAGN
MATITTSRSGGGCLVGRMGREEGNDGVCLGKGENRPWRRRRAHQVGDDGGARLKMEGVHWGGDEETNARLAMGSSRGLE